MKYLKQHFLRIRRQTITVSNVMMIRNDAVEALVSLGYSSKDALVAVKEVEDIENKDSETVLKEALKKLAKF